MYYFKEMRLKKPPKVTYKDLVFQFGMVVLESMTLQAQHICYDYERFTLKVTFFKHKR